MRILPPVEEELRRVVRDARAADPIITVSGLEAVLEKRFNRGFSRTYVAKLAEKVFKESLMQASRTKLDARLNISREKFRILEERLMKIINFEASPPKEGETLTEYVTDAKAGDECVCPDGRKGTVHKFDNGLVCIPNADQS